MEVPLQRASNEYPQHILLWRNDKNIMWVSLLILLNTDANADANTDAGVVQYFLLYFPIDEQNLCSNYSM